jgi:hypothetical protein
MLINGRVLTDTELEMELLCLLPCDPRRVSVSALARDLGLQERRVLGIRVRLANQGYGAEYDFDKRTLWINQTCWQSAQMAARKYWKENHERVA